MPLCGRFVTDRTLFADHKFVAFAVEKGED